MIFQSRIVNILLVLGIGFCFAQLRWCIDPPHQITSSFAEYRVGHFHAGLDLRAVDGTPIKAPAKGWVQKVSISPWGEGKALYFVIGDTLTTVLCHLSNFPQKIQQVVIEEQYKRQSWIVEKWFKRNEFSFEAGDIIAYSGHTGTGPAHIHIEFRKGDKVIAPQLLGYKAPDSIPPTLDALAVIPISGDAWIEESILPFAINSKTPFWRGGDTIRVWGEIAFEASFFDLATHDNPNRLGVHSIKVWLDTVVIFVCQYDSFYAEETSEVGFLYDLGMEDWFQRRFHKLYVPENLYVSPVISAHGDGIINTSSLEGRVYPLKIELTDFAGNTSTNTFYIVPSRPNEIRLQFVYKQRKQTQIQIVGDYVNSALRFFDLEPGEHAMVETVTKGQEWFSLGDKKGYFWAIGTGNTQFYPNFLNTKTEVVYRAERCSLFALGNQLYHYVKLDVPPDCVPEFAIKGVGAEFQMINPDEWLLRHPVEALSEIESPLVSVFVGDPDFPYAELGEFSPILCMLGQWTQSSWQEEKWKAQIYVPANALPATQVVFNWFEPGEGINIASPVFRYLPEWTYFRIPAKITFSPTPNNRITADTLEKLCIVRWWNNDWVYVPTEHKGNTISCNVRALGSFALMLDNAPPVIKLADKTSRSIVDYSNPLAFSISDNLSGFGSENLPQVFVDGKWELSEYDPEDEKLFLCPRESLKKGNHEIKVVAKDRVGNIAETAVRITIE